MMRGVRLQGEGDAAVDRRCLNRGHMLLPGAQQRKPEAAQQGELPVQEARRRRPQTRQGREERCHGKQRHNLKTPDEEVARISS